MARKYIDADLLRKDIDEWENAIADCVGEYSDGVRFALEHFTFVLDSLQQEQQKEPDKSLEEAADDYVMDNIPDFNPELYDGSLFREEDMNHAFIARAEWQASQMPMPEDTVLFQKGVAEGRRLEREDMIKDTYSYDDLYFWYIHNVSVYDKPLWSEKHLKELLKDFIVIPKEDNEDGSK